MIVTTIVLTISHEQEITDITDKVAQRLSTISEIGRGTVDAALVGRLGQATVKRETIQLEVV